jgi:hypothetical protein
VQPRLTSCCGDQSYAALLVALKPYRRACGTTAFFLLKRALFAEQHLTR